ncbi:telomere zinc finger-associated protein [Planococcus citri]|uniref:telomere zinc finger-associated protein n=1 Tax=Planococcus citri TaxID=170843 RepID=UPI0031F8E6D9
MLNSMYYHWTKRHHESTENATNLQPDIALIVGNVHNAVKFFAHKFILSNHSGYFKTLLATYKGYEVHISNINAQTFAYLLTFMYTGHLDLNALNVYELFLASNLLHITEALALCRQFIAESQQQQLSSSSKSIVKPIPRKKIFVPNTSPPFDGIQTLKYQPLRTSNDLSPSIFKPVGNLIKSDFAEDDTNRNRTTVVDENVTKSPSINEDVENPPPNHSKKSNTPPNVILDIACCDGPIKFRKVINKYYDPNKAITNGCSSKDQTNTTQINVACQGCKHVFKNYHKFKKNNTAGSSNGGANAITTSQSTKPTNSAELKSKKKTETSNLQCYTCKTCGSKFPSYYFVHKHRKLHHSETRDNSD